MSSSPNLSLPDLWPSNLGDSPLPSSQDLFQQLELFLSSQSSPPTLLPAESEISGPPVAPNLTHPSPLPLPAGTSLHSHREVLEYLQGFAKTHGFAVVTVRTYVNNRNRPKSDQQVVKLWFSCKRSGTHDPVAKAGKKDTRGLVDTLEGPKRKHSVKTGCWGGTARASLHNEASSPWIIDITSSVHNHPSSHAVAFHEHRQLPHAAITLAHSLFASTTENHDIQRIMERRFDGILITATDIKNLRQRWVREHRRGSTETKSMLEKLGQTPGVIYKPWIDVNGSLQGLMWSTDGHLALSRRYPHVFSLDVTYKTNRYNLYLLHIVGLAANNHTYTSASMILKSKSLSWYTEGLMVWRDWLGPVDMRVLMTDRDKGLMKACRAVFPRVNQMVCLWHVNKNIVARGKGGQEKEEWEEFLRFWREWTVWAKTESEYEEGLARLERLYGPKPRFHTALAYVKGLDEWKQYFVHAWTDEYMHLGQRESSRVEGKHKVIKGYLHKKSGGDLTLVVSRLLMHLETEFKSVTRDMEQERTSGMTELPIILQLDVSNLIDQLRREDVQLAEFRQNSCIISRHALELAQSQWRTAKKLLKHQESLNHASTTEDDEEGNMERVQRLAGCGDPCSGRFEAILGFPCHHRMAELHSNREPVCPSMFSSQWWLESIEGLALWSERRELTSDQPNPFGLVDPTTLNLISVRNPPKITIRGRPVGQRWAVISQDQMDNEDTQAIIDQPTGEEASSQRNPSAFEYAEPPPSRAVWIPGVRRCTGCGQPGHNRRTCEVGRTQLIIQASATDPGPSTSASLPSVAL